MIFVEVTAMLASPPLLTAAVSAAADTFVSYTPSMIADVLRPAKSQLD